MPACMLSHLDIYSIFLPSLFSILRHVMMAIWLIILPIWHHPARFHSTINICYYCLPTMILTMVSKHVNINFWIRSFFFFFFCLIQLVLIIVYFLSCHAHYFSSVFRIDKFQSFVILWIFLPVIVALVRIFSPLAFEL